MRRILGLVLAVVLCFAGTPASAAPMPHGLIALTSLVCTCGSQMGIRASVGTILVESGNHPWSIGDNDGKRSYYFATMSEAVQAAEGLLNAGHANLDIGLSQVNTQNFAEYHLSVETAFVPCTNVNAGMAILWKSFKASRSKYRSDAEAIAASFTAYNSGHYAVGSAYSHNVWDTASALPPALNESDCSRHAQVAHAPGVSKHVVASMRRRIEQ